MYTILNEKNYVTKSQIKWNLIFETVILSWTQIYNIPAKCCSNTKLHWFQYRILQRILATDDFLLKCCIKHDNLCSFVQSYLNQVNNINCMV